MRGRRSALDHIEIAVGGGSDPLEAEARIGERDLASDKLAKFRQGRRGGRGKTLGCTKRDALLIVDLGTGKRPCSGRSDGRLGLNVRHEAAQRDLAAHTLCSPGVGPLCRRDFQRASHAAHAKLGIDRTNSARLQIGAAQIT